MQRDADENRPQASPYSEEYIDGLIAAERRRKAEAEAADKQRLAESRARIARMEAEADAVRKIQQMTQTLITECGIDPKRAAELAQQRCGGL
jgi:hypothetical protein